MEARHLCVMEFLSWCLAASPSAPPEEKIKNRCGCVRNCRKCEVETHPQINGNIASIFFPPADTRSSRGGAGEPAL